MQVITTQPGLNIPHAPGVVIMPVPETIPIQGVPAGLEYLTQLDMIVVHQIKDIIEILTDWETKNRYALKNGNGEQAYFAFEESGCCERQFCGPQRGFTIHIVDNFKREVLTIQREFKCCANECLGLCSCCGCCQTECSIESPTFGFLGSVRQRQAFCATCLDILDAQGNLVLSVDGPCCCALIGCNDKEFPIRTTNGDVIGAITKKWGGCFREAFTNADTFTVQFPVDLDVKIKSVLLGATFIIDFMEFEQKAQAQSI